MGHNVSINMDSRKDISKGQESKVVLYKACNKFDSDAYFNIVLLRSLEQTSNGQPKAANVLWSLRTVDLVWPSSHYSQILYLQVQYVISPAIIGCQRSPCSET